MGAHAYIRHSRRPIHVARRRSVTLSLVFATHQNMIACPPAGTWRTTHSWPDNPQPRPLSPKTSRFWAYAGKVHTFDTRARLWDIDGHHGKGDEILDDNDLRKRLADLVSCTGDGSAWRSSRADGEICLSHRDRFGGSPVWALREKGPACLLVLSSFSCKFSADSDKQPCDGLTYRTTFSV
jgi:hypothetical protein